MITFILVKIFLLSFLINQFEPLQWILDLLPKTLLTAIITMLLTCLKCTSFWVGLIISGDIFIASGAFLIGFIIDKILMKVNKINLK